MSDVKLLSPVLPEVVRPLGRVLGPPGEVLAEAARPPAVPVGPPAGALHPPAISVDEIWPWALFGLALLALVYLVGADQGASSVLPGNLIHEWVHDGRHLLGFPCH